MCINLYTWICLPLSLSLPLTLPLSLFLSLSLCPYPGQSLRTCCSNLIGAQRCRGRGTRRFSFVRMLVMRWSHQLGSLKENEPIYLQRVLVTTLPDILKSQLATQFTIRNDYRAGFWEFPWNHAPQARPCRRNGRLTRQLYKPLIWSGYDL